ncbi:ribonuclease HI family protein [Diaphorobacter aerolatus]|uniref:Ribonuclease HI family protein n=1 Tax=Diaphorobacter aerolatus TaxID=1288495 RepID=A0A7H0GL32_9BURK|nr:ribonuclease HI family protein [Diaphorobacter aerolatus]QNP48998.1 ribonuclease HI family protein [Diaphorobacter aerolatus]
MQTRTWLVYIDGSAMPNPGRLGIGGVVYAPDGGVHRFSQRLRRVGCNNEAEARAGIYALEWLHEMRAAHVLIHTDNSILADQLGLAVPKRIERLHAVYEKARNLARQFSSVRVQWIPRHKNAIADALARARFTRRSMLH